MRARLVVERARGMVAASEVRVEGWNGGQLDGGGYVGDSGVWVCAVIEVGTKS